ncbi:MAG: helix-turn-helix transcriptional regulator [Marinifilaceae bacterium]|nr:helix-turn-helix transcriptional regulator [Marinifilaceae bacterium]
MQVRLKQIIEQKGLTAERFANMIGANASTISHILNGRNKPGFDIIYNIIKAFPDINIGWLITGEGNMYISPDSSSVLPPVEERTLFDIPMTNNAPSIIKSADKNTSIPGNTATGRRKLMRIILFFDDGSFEDYSNR